MMIRKLFFLLIILVYTSICSGSNSGLKLTEEQWRQLSKGVDYTESFKSQKVERKKGTSVKMTPYDFSNLKYLFYTIVVGILLVLIVRIFYNLNKNPAIKEAKINIDSINEIEEKMHELNLDDLLKEAISVKNFRIALRIKFLIIIKMLSQNGNINWAKEKTNWEYYTELNEKKLSSQFKDVILNFERVWYGELMLTEDQFNLVSPSYENLTKQLITNE